MDKAIINAKFDKINKYPFGAYTLGFYYNCHKYNINFTNIDLYSIDNFTECQDYKYHITIKTLYDNVLFLDNIIENLKETYGKWSIYSYNNIYIGRYRHTVVSGEYTFTFENDIDAILFKMREAQYLT